MRTGGSSGGRSGGKTRQGAGVILGLQRSTVTPGPQGVPEIHHKEKAVDRFFLPPHLDIHFLNRGQLRRTLQMINGYLSMSAAPSEVIVKTSSKLILTYFQTHYTAKCAFDKKIWWGI